MSDVVDAHQSAESAAAAAAAGDAAGAAGAAMEVNAVSLCGAFPEKEAAVSSSGVNKDADTKSRNSSPTCLAVDLDGDGSVRDDNVLLCVRSHSSLLLDSLHELVAKNFFTENVFHSIVLILSIVSVGFQREQEMNWHYTHFRAYACAFLCLLFFLNSRTCTYGTPRATACRTRTIPTAMAPPTHSRRLPCFSLHMLQPPTTTPAAAAAAAVATAAAATTAVAAPMAVGIGPN